MTFKESSSGSSSVPSSLPRGFQSGGLCCLVPSGLRELFPLAAQCQKEVRQAMMMNDKRLQDLGEFGKGGGDSFSAGRMVGEK